MPPHHTFSVVDRIRRALLPAIWIVATVLLWRIAWYWGVLGGLVIGGLLGRAQEFILIRRLRAERLRQGIPAGSPVSETEARTIADFVNRSTGAPRHDAARGEPTEIQQKAMDELGLSPEDAVLFEAELRAGDKSAAEARIAAAQNRLRAAIEARTGVDPRSTLPAIGREISWADVVRHVFAVKRLDRAGTTVGPNDEVRPGGPGPYGYLHVESPILSQQVSLPIVHRDDFLLATFASDDRERPAGSELLVTYAPERILPGGLSGSASHVLHYAVVPKGTLERYYSMEGDRHMAAPNPERIFGRFVYRGEIRVRLVTDLHL